MSFNFIRYVLASSVSVWKDGKKTATFLAVFLPVYISSPSLQEQASITKTTFCPCSPLGQRELQRAWSRLFCSLLAPLEIGTRGSQ